MRFLRGYATKTKTKTKGRPQHSSIPIAKLRQCMAHRLSVKTSPRAHGIPTCYPALTPPPNTPYPLLGPRSIHLPPQKKHPAPGLVPVHTPTYPYKPRRVAVIFSKKRVGGKGVVDGTATERWGYRAEVFRRNFPSSLSARLLRCDSRARGGEIQRS